jgi:hypothetical protein
MDNYSFTGQFTDMKAIGITPSGLRLDVSFAGTVTEGALAGERLQGIDYLLIRPDGIAVVDARELIGSGVERQLAVVASGYIVAPFEMPPLAVLASPSFTWPDVELPMHGSSRVETSDPTLAAANHTVYAWTGTVNVARASLAVAAHSVDVLRSVVGSHRS